MSKTVENASTLLNTWTRMLSQTEHNQRLILNPNWNGATQDLAEIENEALRKQQEAERRAAELERRREEARRKAEDGERQKLVAPSAPRGTSTRGTRVGRGRGLVRGASSGYGSSSGYGVNTTSSSTGSGRGTSGIGRGFGSVRGRSRGASSGS